MKFWWENIAKSMLICQNKVTKVFVKVLSENAILPKLCVKFIYLDL